MSRETDKKIAEWLGYTTKEEFYQNGTNDYFLQIEKNPKNDWMEVPNYSTSDADAITLLPVLVERGCSFGLCGSIENNTDMTPSENFEMTYQMSIDMRVTKHASTIAAAISSAVLELIEKEEGE